MYIVSLINAQRRNASLGPVGFINPTLYSSLARDKFNDVTAGTNNCCHYNGANPAKATCCQAGFRTAVGWDPVTGLGSIYFPKLANLFNGSLAFIPYNLTSPPVDNSILSKISLMNLIMIALFVGAALLGACITLTWCCHKHKRRRLATVIDQVTIARQQQEAYNASQAAQRQQQRVPRAPPHGPSAAAGLAEVPIPTYLQARAMGGGEVEFGMTPTAVAEIDYSSPSNWSYWYREASKLYEMGFDDATRIQPLLVKYLGRPTTNGVVGDLQPVINALL